MSVARDFVSALAQLLANPALRETFSSSPQKVADLLNVTETDRSLLVSLPIEQVERQARLLITKRMRETFRLLPLTVGALGADAAAYFSEYAAEHWPETHRRHALDALNFCKFLYHRHLPFNQSEYNRVQFNNKPKWICVRLVKDALIKGKSRYAFQVFYRLKEWQGEWRIYFKV